MMSVIGIRPMPPGIEEFEPAVVPWGVLNKQREGAKTMTVAGTVGQKLVQRGKAGLASCAAGCIVRRVFLAWPAFYNAFRYSIQIR